MPSSRNTVSYLIQIALMGFLLVGCVEAPSTVNGKANGSTGTNGSTGSTGTTGQTGPTSQTYALSIGRSGNGLVTTSDGSINCGIKCSAQFQGIVILTAKADNGSSFTGWGGACSGSSANCTISVNQATFVSATFAQNTGGSSNALNVSVSGPGKISSTPSGINNCGASGSGVCTASFASSTSVNLVATANSGAQFVSWGGDCSSSGTTPNCTISMSSARNVTATFSDAATNPIRSVSVSVPKVEGAGPGRVAITPGNLSCAATCIYPFAEGTLIRAEAIANSGYEFVSWSGGCNPDTQNPLVCTRVSALGATIVANFKKAAASGITSLTVRTTGSGSIFSDPINGTRILINGNSSWTTNIPSGTSLTFHVKSEEIPEGYGFSGWSESACNTQLDCTFVVSGSSMNVVATFAPLSESDFSITASVTQTGNNASMSGSVTAASLHWDQWLRNKTVDNRICLFIGIVHNETVFLLSQDGNWKAYAPGETDCLYQLPERTVSGEAFNGPLSFFASGSPIYLGYGRGQQAIDEMVSGGRYQQIGIVP